MVEKSFRERAGAVLNRGTGTHMEPLSKGMHMCGQKESGRKSLPEINTERLGLSEAGGMLQSHHANGQRRLGAALENNGVFLSGLTPFCMSSGFTTF